MDFKSLKKNRKSAFEQLADNMEKTKGGNYGNDLPLWSITRDKAGNGQAIIRFYRQKTKIFLGFDYFPMLFKIKAAGI